MNAASYLEEDHGYEGGHDRRLFLRLVGYVRPHLVLALGSLALVGLATALALAMPAFFRLVVDDVAPPRGAGERFRVFALLYLAFEFLRLGNTWLSSYLLQALGQRIVLDLRMDVFRRLHQMPLSFFQKQPVGRLVTRVVFDVETLAEMFGAGLITVVTDVSLVVGIAVSLLVIDWRMGLVTLAILPPMIALAAVFRWSVRRNYREVTRQKSVVNSVTAETVNGVRELQAFVREERTLADFARRNDELLRLSQRSIHRYGLFQVGFSVLSSIGIAVVISVVGTAVVHGRLELAVFAQFYFLVRMLVDPLRDLAEKYNVVQTGVASADRIFRVMDQPPDPILDTPRRTRPPVAGRIEFDRVDFRYPDSPVALEGVSFAIEPGQSVALVGHTGSGKSTIVNLLCRHYDVAGGAVRLDGVDVREWHPDDLRRNVVVVDQDVFLFAGTIRSNLTLGDAFDDAAVERAARLAGAHEFIAKLPGGYGEAVVEKGMTLSAGQRQLLGFARAVLRDPPILVLDEATSQIDTPTERLIQEAVGTLIAGRTSLVIAHRLSTVQRCDRIVVLEKGRVVETGTHAELLALGGRYRVLHDAQFAHASPPEPP